MLLLLLLSLAYCRVIRVGPGFEFKPTALREAVDAGDVGDVVELSAGEYVLEPVDGVGLPIQRSITLRAGVGVQSPPIIRVATADGTDAVIGIGASNVRLENLVIGRPLAGAQSNVERVIAVLVSSGTQDEAPTHGSPVVYNKIGETVKRSAPVAAIHGARAHAKRNKPSGGDVPNRDLSAVSLTNIDFTASLSHTNLAFGPGAYSNLKVQQSRFSESTDANSIVTAAGARFIDATIERNIFSGSPAVLNGIGLEIGTNYWAPALRTNQTTFCLDKPCTKFGPVVDADAPSKAYGSISDAVVSGVRHIQATVHEVEWARSAETACAIISIADTTISGVDIQDCSQTTDDIGLGVTNINLRHLCKGSSAALTSYEGALSSVSNVQFTVFQGVQTAISIITNRKSVTGGTPAATMLFDHVTIYGNQKQTAMVLQTPSTRVMLNEFEIFGTSVGILHHGGLLSITDSVVLVEEVGIRLSGATAHGLRVVDTLFFKATGIAFGDVRASSMTELYIGCSRFLFAGIQLPRDCAENSQVCAAGLRHNTIIVAPQTFGNAERSLLTRGANHYEEQSLEQAAQYYKYTDENRRPQFQFELHDHQGRIDDASGAATIGGTNTHWTFALATHIPMRQECFAATIPSIDGVKGRVVSNLFDLRTDAPEACVSVALRVALRDRDVDLQAQEDLAIYAVQHIGSPAATWLRATSHTVEVSDDGATTAIDASSARGQLTRAVVVAAHAAIHRQEAAKAPPAPTQPHVALAVTRANRQFCVACGSDRIPANIVDERCGGGSSTPVFTDIDKALAAVADVKTASVSLLIYGSQCVSKQCSIEFGVMAPNKLVVEGVGPSDRGSLRRLSSCSTATSFIRTGFGVTLRYLLIAADSNIASAIPTCAIEAIARVAEGPRVAYSTVSGGVCIGKGRTNTVLLNNEISVASGRVVTLDDQTSGSALDSNSLSGGSIRAASGVELTNNFFNQDTWLDVVDGAQLVATGNTFAARRADSTKAKPCVVASVKAKTQLDKNSFGEHCELRLSGSTHQLSAGELIGVRVFVSGASSVVGVKLTGDSFIQAASGVVLENVVVDRTTTSVGDALRGAPVRQTNCGKQYEPGLGGFALDQSTVYDEAGAELISHLRWPTETDRFVDFATGAVVPCSSTPTSAYCICAMPKAQLKPVKERALPPPPQAIAVAQKAEKKFGVLSSSPAAKKVEQKPKKVTAPPPPAPPLLPFKQIQQQRYQPQFDLATTSATTSSHTAIWIILGIFAVFFLIVLIIVAVLLSKRGSESAGDQTTSTSQRAGKSAPVKRLVFDFSKGK